MDNDDKENKLIRGDQYPVADRNTISNTGPSLNKNLAEPGAISPEEDNGREPEITDNPRRSLDRRLRSPSPKTLKRKRRRNWLWPVVALVALVAGGVLIFWFVSPQTETKTLTQTAVVSANSVVALSVGATGQVQAKADLPLSFPVSGNIVAVPAVQGQEVKKGDVIAKIDDTDLDTAVKTAQASLDSAKANFEKIKAGSTPEQIAIAQEQVKQAEISARNAVSGNSLPADVQSAESALVAAKTKQTQDKQGGTPEDKASDQSAVEAAQANLDSAQANLDKLLTGPDQATLSSAQATYDQAQANLEKTRSNLNSAKVAAQVARDQALTALNRAQDAYSTQYNSDHNADGSLKSGVKDADIQNETDLYRALQDAQGNYNKADIALNDANVSYNTGVQQAQSTVDDARVQLDKVKAGPTEADIASARATVDQAKASLATAQNNLSSLNPTDTTLAADQASVDQAQANLAKLTSGGTPSDIATAQSQLKIEQAALQNLLDGPTTDDLTIAQAQLDDAQAGYNSAETNLEDAVLTAPFDGVISSLTVVPGQEINAGTQVANLLDTSELHIDVNVGESDITKIQLNQAVTLSFDALTGESFTGRVTFISPKSVVTNNVVSYLVTVTLDGQGKNSLQAAFPDQFQKFEQISQQQKGSGNNLPATGANANLRFCGYNPRIQATGQPRVGMTATVTVCENVKAGVLAVPSRAVQTGIINSTRQNYVSVQVDEKGTVKQVPVTIGLRGDNTIEITGGELKDQDEVVINATPTNTSIGTNRIGGGFNFRN